MFQHIRQYLRYISIGISAAAIMATAATTASAATRTWDAGSPVNNYWMTAENWEGDVAPVAGDELIFPAGVADTTAISNFPAGTKFTRITFHASYVLDGNRIVIGSVIEHLGTELAALYCDVTLEGGPAATGVTLHVAQASGVLQFGTVISSGALPNSMLRKTGPGTVRLLGANTYGGLTAIEEGEVRISHASALGSSADATVVSDGAVLGVDTLGSPIIAEPLLLAGQGTASANDGALMFRKGATMSGAIALFGASTPIISTLAGPAGISGAISGGTGFIKGGAELLRLSGPNTYTGMTTIAEGGLAVVHPQALGSPSSGTTLLPHAELHIEVADIINEPLFAQSEAAPAPSCAWSRWCAHGTDRSSCRTPTGFTWPRDGFFG